LKVLRKNRYNLEKIFSIRLILGFWMFFWVFEAMDKFFMIYRVFWVKTNGLENGILGKKKTFCG